MPWSFWSDVGPVLLVCISVPLSAVLLYFYIITPFREKRACNRWLLLHRSSMRNLIILQYLARSLYRRLPPCSHCSGSDLRFWEHHKNLLVLRCRNCKRNYTLNHQSHPEVRHILRFIPALLVALVLIRQQPDTYLGRHLKRCCRPFEAYLVRK